MKPALKDGPTVRRHLSAFKIFRQCSPLKGMTVRDCGMMGQIGSAEFRAHGISVTLGTLAVL